MADAAPEPAAALSPEAEAAKIQLAALSTSTMSSADMNKDMEAELASGNSRLLHRVRHSIVAAKLEQPNVRLSADLGGAGGMKTVDMNALLGIIKETEVKLELQKAVQESEKMVKDISSLLSSEGFL